MKTKTIEKLINQKFSKFLASIKDTKVQKLVQKNSLISGGCIASMLLNDKVNDYDIYFTNKETVLAVANYYAQLYKVANPELDVVVVDIDNLSDESDIQYYHEHGLKEAGRVSVFCKGQKYEVADEEESVKVVEIENSEEKYEVLFMSPNAISLSDKIQIILRFYGNAKEIHTNYDYVHCTNYWLSYDTKLYLNQPALEAILAKELIYVGSKYPIASVLRTRKFINRGWTISAGAYLKMCYQISKLNLDDISVLEDQLVGVDIAYFSVLIEALKAARQAHKNEGKTFNLSYEYISEIVDRIFY